MPEKVGDGRGWARGVVVGATLTLALFNVNSARSWLALQSPDSLPAFCQPAVDAWWNLTSKVGLDAPRATLARAWDGVKTASWPGAPSAPPSSGSGPDR